MDGFFRFFRSGPSDDAITFGSVEANQNSGKRFAKIKLIVNVGWQQRFQRTPHSHARQQRKIDERPDCDR